MELTPRAKSDLEETWTMHVNGSASRSASEEDVILINQEGQMIEHAAHFAFLATNNVAKYEALLTRIRIIDTISITKVRICTNSRLVA